MTAIRTNNSILEHTFITHLVQQTRAALEEQAGWWKWKRQILKQHKTEAECLCQSWDCQLCGRVEMGRKITEGIPGC